MRRVDLADQAMWYSLLSHISCKWWKKVFFGFLEVTFTNTMVIMRRLQPNKKHDRTKIRMEIITQLTWGYGNGRSVPIIGPHTTRNAPFLWTKFREPIDEGHHVYMDNLFSSSVLFNDLAAQSNGACSTLYSYWFETPDIINRARPKKEDPAVFHRDGKLLCTTWMDCILITTVHNETQFVKRTRCRNSEDGWQERNKPKAIELYTKFMRSGLGRPGYVVLPA